MEVPHISVIKVSEIPSENVNVKLFRFAIPIISNISQFQFKK